MAEDLLAGMTEEDVALKPYKYTLEMFFYSNPNNIPKDDPHWSIISLLNLDDLIGKMPNHVESKIFSQDEVDAVASCDSSVAHS